MKEELDGVGWMVQDQDETHKVKNDKCNARLIYLGWKVIFHPMRNDPKLLFFFSLFFILFIAIINWLNFRFLNFFYKEKFRYWIWNIFV